MIYIKKGSTPNKLVEFQQQEGAAYGNADFPRKAVYEALLQEQGGICAYCMSRITMETIHIEHWIPQKGEHYTGEYTQEDCDRLSIDYQNMLGVCPGRKEQSYKHTTCDHHRGNARIKIDPREEWMINTLRYLPSGKMESDDKDISHDISNILNLNEPMLVENRKSAWRACEEMLKRKHQKGTWSKAMLEKQIDRYQGRDKQGNRYPYAGVVLYWLQKHQKRATR